MKKCSPEYTYRSIRVDCIYDFGISNHLKKGNKRMEKTLSNKEYTKILADGLMLSINDLFAKQIKEIDDLGTLENGRILKDSPFIFCIINL